MNRRHFILVLGGVPLLAHGLSAPAAAAEKLVASPGVCIHDVNATSYCPVCAGWVPDPSLSPVQEDINPAATGAAAL